MRLVFGWKEIVKGSFVSWASGFIGAGLAFVFANYGIFFAFIAFLPPALQLPAATLFGGLALWGAIMIPRVVDQPKLNAKIEESRNVAEPVQTQ